uniref:Uncharacterized protein n=1 Tax=Chrysemys picta bellii TaxID=8478 RepID=A0A8C3HW53_CHRPI
STMHPQLLPLALALLVAVPPGAQAGKEQTRPWAWPLSPSGVGPGLGSARRPAANRSGGSGLVPVPRGPCINRHPTPEVAASQPWGTFLWVPRCASANSLIPPAGRPPPRGTARPGLTWRGAGGNVYQVTCLRAAEPGRAHTRV